MTMTAGTVATAGPRPARVRQMPGLDGLRALAIVAVVVYHLYPGWLRGGFLGVDVFFVISGYLITALLLSEWSRTSSLSLRRFWGRRARRLLPAVAVLLLAVAVLAELFARDSLYSLRADLPSSVFYVMNWRLVLHHDSYVASLGRPPLLLHLWSLAVEEQFYLVWPVALLLMRKRLSNSGVAVAAAGGAVVSALLMAVLFRPGGDPSAVYFSSETHAEGLLIGCALAAAIPPWRMAATVSPAARRVLERSGAAALVLVLAGISTLGFSSSVTYRGGMLFVDLATMVVIATVAHPASRLGTTLGRQPLRWLGLRSYSIYLWHWPIFQLTRPGADLAWPGWAVTFLRLALTAAAAELSYRYVEQPWRTGHAQAWLVSVASRQPRIRVAGVVVAPVVAVAAILATSPGPSAPAILSEGSTAAARRAPVAPPAASTASTVRGAPRPGGRSAQWSRIHQELPTTTVPPPPTTPPARPLASAEPILAIGDSVLLAASPALDAALGQAITVDASVGRQVDVGLQRLADYRSSGALSRYRSVVIDLGTNGTFSPQEFDEMVRLVQGVPRVVVVDVHADRPWVAAVNATVSAGVAAHPSQMVLADWDHAADDPNLLYGDGIHPNQAGARIYTQLLESALTKAG